MEGIPSQGRIEISALNCTLGKMGPWLSLLSEMLKDFSKAAFAAFCGCTKQIRDAVEFLCL